MSGQESKRHPEIDRYGGFDTAKRERKDCAGEKLTARKLGTPPPKQNVSNEWHKDEKVDPPWMSQESKVCHIVRHGRINARDVRKRAGSRRYLRGQSPMRLAVRGAKGLDSRAALSNAENPVLQVLEASTKGRVVGWLVSFRFDA